MPVEKFANRFATTLSAAVADTTGTSISVANAAVTALQGGQFRVRVGDELMLVTATGAAGASPWTVTRGVEGSTATTHASGVAVTHVLTAASRGPTGTAGTWFTDTFGTFDPRTVSAGVVVGLNVLIAGRAEMPRAGTISDLALYVHVASGNISVAVYDVDATTMTQLWTTGAIVCPAAGWRSVGNPALAVAAGDQRMFVVTADNGTMQVGRTALVNNLVGTLPPDYLPGATRMHGSLATSHPAPATITVASFGAVTSIPAFIGRVT
ncbi:MAG: hypothetical protein H0V18_08275 [Pyrinomonadaceae bacterium]|nr:hypothetical protein [Pyrinomonadaceae bacterium]